MQDPVRKELAELARLVVVKVGTRVLTRDDGTLHVRRIQSLATQIQRLREAGRQVVVVSSGAVGAGMSELRMTSRPIELAKLQAVAAVGQTKLIECYDSTFRQGGTHVAQVLLTAEDFSDRGRYLNVRNTILTLLELNAVPIINENDTVAVDELMLSFGDNDRLAALVTNAIRAPLLIILSDVAGLYDGHPDQSSSKIISLVRRVDGSIENMASDKANSVSRGGMRSKLDAARAVTMAGENMIIASGNEPDVLERLLAGEVLGTAFLAEGKAVSPFKRWLGFSVQPRGQLILDAGAREAIIKDGRSLLPIGIARVEGDFEKGDAVSLCDEQLREVARGLTNYSSDQIRLVQGMQSERVVETLGQNAYKAVIHRDNMTVTVND